MDEKNTAKINETLTLPVSKLLDKLRTTLTGLSTEEVEKRLDEFGTNEVGTKKRQSVVIEFLYHFRNPLVIILIVAAILSGVLGEITNSIIIFCIVLISTILDFFQEYRAGKAAEELKKRIATKVPALRDNIKQDTATSDLVPGDILALSAGDIVPADCRVLISKDFFIDQSALTGESFPAEKAVTIPEKLDMTDITRWTNYLFMGTSVASGTATAVVVKTGNVTEYGAIVKKSMERKPQTEFDRGLRRFGSLITQITLVIVVVVLLVNALFKHGVLDSVLFAVALAVGLTPELLPLILSINLAKGAASMSKKGVIVKRMASIQNFGSMDILCTDKTGTLTQNRVTVIYHIDASGKDDEKVLLYSYLNSFHQTGLKSPLDDAILKHKELSVEKYQKIDEIPFDFVRKRVSIVVQDQQKLLITKGAPEEIYKICNRYELDGKTYDFTGSIKAKNEQKYQSLSAEGYRILGICYRVVTEEKQIYSIPDESSMVFLGFVVFMDPLKETALESLQMLRQVGVRMKILTGDNEIVTKKICQELGFQVTKTHKSPVSFNQLVEIRHIVRGSELEEMNDTTLAMVVEKNDIFARVTPAQKNRIITALKNNGHVVGFMGDGINDTPSMKTADIGISVENAVDVAKESADIILLKSELTSIGEGVLEGRKTFGNTMKYIMMGTSSNFGNMFSAAAASLFLPFLPMLPIQILLNNLLYDASQVTLPTDNVDAEYTVAPKRLQLAFIKKFMIFFGPISSAFDFLTFFVLLVVFKANANASLFQTAWFVESLFTQTLIIFVIRTRRIPFYKSRPSRSLIISIALILSIALIIPYTPLARVFGFVPLPWKFLGILVIFIIVYISLVEAMKAWFYRRYKFTI
ncbi:MAG: magnesium-translocating P-type ATPase [Chloroflexi bacterium]|nr:magnesium-translocating P-type ATPase [Chloroflexota bacterium]